MWSAIGNVEFNCQMASHHVPRFHLWCYKHNFTATDDSSGSRNGLRKVQLVFCLTGTTLRAKVDKREVREDGKV